MEVEGQDQISTKMEYALKPIDKKQIEENHANAMKNIQEKIKISTMFLWELIDKKIKEESKKPQKKIEFELTILHHSFPQDSTRMHPSLCDYDKIIKNLEEIFGENCVYQNYGAKRFQYTPNHNI